MNVTTDDAEDMLYDVAYRISCRIKDEMKIDSPEKVIFKSDVIRHAAECCSAVEKDNLSMLDLVPATFQRLLMTRKTQGDSSYSIHAACISQGVEIERVILRVEKT